MGTVRTLAFTFPLASALVVLACGTDNGDPVFGPTFEGGTTSSTSSGGSSGGSSGASSSGGDVDGGSDDGGTKDDGAVTSCTTGTVAVLAGNDTTLSGAIQSKGGAWAGAAIAGGGALSKPALVAFGQGFLGVTHGSGNVLQSTAYTTSWSAATTFGNAGVKGPPALAVAGTSAHVVYSAGPGVQREFAHGIHDGNAWNAATATVGTKPNHSFGTRGAGLGAAGTTVVFMENGTDYELYERVFDGTWGAATAITGAASIGDDVPAFPVLTSAEGKWDLVAVYVRETTRRLSYATRDATSKTWSDGGVVQMLATTDEPFSFARVGTSTFLLAFRGQDGNGYFIRGTVDGAGAFTWTTAAAIGGSGNVSVDSAPAVAKGVCGDDAIVVYASAGQVKATRLRGASWTAAESVTGASGARVAVATK